MKKRLFVFEKKASLENILKSLETNFTENDTAIVAPTIVSFKFDYPKELHYKDIPYINKLPKYKNNFKNISYINYYRGKEKNINIFKDFYLLNVDPKISLNKNKIIDDMKYFLSNIDEIICMTDSDHTGIRGFDFYFKHYLNFSLKDIENYNVKITFVDTCNGLNKENIIESYKNRIEIKDSKKYKQLQSAYLKKDFFEYNYNLNSMILFNNIIKAETLNNITLTKNMIQLLYLIKYNQYSVGKCIQEMSNLNIGSLVSRNGLITNLKNINFIEENFNKELNTNVITISKKGETFLNYLHPIMKDFKLSLKLSDDYYSDMSFEDFKLKWSKYLQKSFKKQKNYLRKLS